MRPQFVEVDPEQYAKDEVGSMAIEVIVYTHAVILSFVHSINAFSHLFVAVCDGRGR